ncbi:MAG: helix-turn-helix domain-containing protein [Bacteroidota bacterium]
MTGLIKAQFVIESSLLLLIALLSFEKTLRKGENSRLYLVAFLFVSALYLAASGIHSHASLPIHAWANAARIPLSLSVIPLFFLFLSAVVTNKQRPVKFVFYHLATPSLFLITMPLVILFSYLNDNLSVSGGLMNGWTIAGHTFLFVQTVFYTLMFFVKFRVYSRRLQEYYRKAPGSVIYFQYLIVAFSGYFLLMDSWLMTLILPEKGFQMIQSLSMFIAAGITGWLGLNLEIIKKPEETAITGEPLQLNTQEPLVFTETEAEVPVTIPEDIIITQSGILDAGFTEPEDKPKKKTGLGRKPFDDQQKKALYKRMLNHLITNELYTDPKLTLKQLANDLGTNTRYLSMVINEFQGRNFNQMLNYYRVKKVMRLLVDNEAESYSYLGLAQKAGFHSKSVFIAAFKSQTGTTPSEFSGTMKKLIKA